MDEIKRKIDSILESVSTKIANHDYAGLEDLLASREQFISELITKHRNDAALQPYLNAVRTHDRNMMQVLKETRDEVGKALKKVDKVKEYINL